MPQPNKIPLAFASSGDKNVIPENTETTGLASWREGFPAITSTPFSEGGIAPKRADFNGIFNALSQAVMWMQQGGVYAYDVNTDYEAGNVVLDAGVLYVANAANGPSSAVVQPSTDTTGATWKLVRLDLATQSAAGYMSAADKTKVDSVILTNATQSAAGYMSAADKTILDSVTGITSYSSGVDYAVGSIVSYSGTNYVAISANGPSTAVAAPTDQSKWLPLYGIFSDHSDWNYLSFGPHAVFFGQCWTQNDSPSFYTFPYPFINPPAVFLSFVSTSGAYAQMRVTSVSKTGFGYDYIHNGVHVTGASAYFCVLGFK